MTELELKKLIDQTIGAIEEYNNGKIEKGLWKTKINESVADLIEKSHVLNSSGRTCPTCGGSGRA